MADHLKTGHKYIRFLNVSGNEISDIETFTELFLLTQLILPTKIDIKFYCILQNFTFSFKSNRNICLHEIFCVIPKTDLSSGFDDGRIKPSSKPSTFKSSVVQLPSTDQNWPVEYCTNSVFGSPMYYPPAYSALETGLNQSCLCAHQSFALLKNLNKDLYLTVKQNQTSLSSPWNQS
jgi:hypothetical protein